MCKETTLRLSNRFRNIEDCAAPRNKLIISPLRTTPGGLSGLLCNHNSPAFLYEDLYIFQSLLLVCLYAVIYEVKETTNENDK